ncbi:hypothetical protein [Amycolatopsis rubida]|uniref:Uncharacterized protein n=1 Tax=Amycolatopsis rubida TaxID=112413 RepID=A0A1I5XC41_9PSEU|nr:hypothetical protein [Amycolatopsis rubida]SFQ29416.1 hypothetical protein SAMN05421854_110144 [Amycolatopsis rubida]
MDEVLNSELQTAVHRRLDYLDDMAKNADDPSKSKLADTAIPQLTEGFRDLLAAHDTDELGRCLSCSPRRFFGRVECKVWRSAHQHLITDADERATGGRHRLRHGQTTS